MDCFIGHQKAMSLRRNSLAAYRSATGRIEQTDGALGHIFCDPT